MRIGILSDVHGNVPALEACLAQLDQMGLDQRVFLGDAVGYLPGEVECLALLAASGFLCQQGNHEAMLLLPTERALAHEPLYRFREARTRLSDHTLEALASWPRSRVLEADRKRILFVHGTPQDPLEGYAYPDTDLSRWTELPYDAVFTGNAHRPFTTQRGRILIANAGSVGLPRDVGSLACFAVYDSTDGTCAHYRVSFDVDLVFEHAGDRIHPAVHECLCRRSEHFVGEVLR